MGKTEKLQVRVTPQEAAKLAELAEATARTRSDVLRSLILSAYVVQQPAPVAGPMVAENARAGGAG